MHLEQIRVDQQITWTVILIGTASYSQMIIIMLITLLAILHQFLCHFDYFLCIVDIITVYAV